LRRCLGSADKLTDISAEQLEQLKTAEEEMGAILLAYSY